MLHQGAELYGSDKVFAQTVSILAEHYDIWVILNNSGPLVEKIALPSNQIIICNLAALRRKNFQLTKIVYWFFELIKSLIRLNKIIKDKKIDIIYSNTGALIVGALLAKIKNKKHIWHIHEIVETPKIVKEFCKWFIPRFSDKVIVVSNAVKRSLQSNKSDKKDEVLIVIHNGFDWSHFVNSAPLKDNVKMNKNNILIGYFGRIHTWKGQDILVEALNVYKSDHPEFEAIFVGDVFPGYESIFEQLKSTVKLYGLDNNVKFLGFRSDVSYLMSKCDVIVIPSKLPDPFPTTVLEAMVSGKAVIASDIGGIPEMIKHNENGLLFKPNDYNDLACKLSSLAKNRHLRDKLGSNAQKYVLQNFTIENYKNNLLKIFTQ